MTMPEVVQGLPPATLWAILLVDLVLILVVARGCGRLCLAIGQPRVVGEIIAGVVLGPTVLGFQLAALAEFSPLSCEASRQFMRVGTEVATFQAAPPTVTNCLFPAQAQGLLSVIGQLALALFMFLVGIQLDPATLKGKWASISTVSVGCVLVPAAAAVAIAPVLYNSKYAAAALSGDGLTPYSSFVLFLAGVLAVTAFPVMVRVLQEKGLASSQMGSVGIASAAVVTVLMFLLVAIATGASRQATAFDHAQVLVGAALYLGAMLLVVRPLLERWQAKLFDGDDLSVSGFVWILVLVFASCLVSDRLGLSPIVGGFMAGVVLPARARMLERMVPKLEYFSIFVLLPVFLAVSGLRTDLRTLGWAWVPGLVLILVAAVVSKWGGGMVAARATGMSWREGNLIGVLMNCRGLLVLVVALLALDAKVITPQMQAAIVLMALVTTAMTGPLVDWAMGRLDRTDEPMEPAAPPA